MGGPHPVFTEIEKQMSNGNECQFPFFSEQYALYKSGFQINPANHLFSIKVDQFAIVPNLRCSQCGISRKQRQFNEVESAGSEIQYRCIDCRKCGNCKNPDHIEMLSIRE